MTNKTPTISITPGGHYPELHQFRHQIHSQEKTPLHLPYTAHKKRTWAYKVSFALLSLLFFTLGAIAYVKTFTWTYAFLFGDCQIIKNTLCMLCGLLSSSSLGMALLIRTDKEAINSILRSGKHLLSRTFHSQRLEEGLHSFLVFGSEYNKLASLRHLHHETSDKMTEARNDTLALVKRIDGSDEIEAPDKEVLFNQTLLEFQDKLKVIVGRFARAGAARQIAHEQR